MAGGSFPSLPDKGRTLECVWVVGFCFFFAWLVGVVYQWLVVSLVGWLGFFFFYV